MRIILVPVFVVFFILPFFAPGTASFSGFVALGIFLIACLTDFFDGYLARKLNQITTLGKFLDPIADKLLVAAALFCVVLLQTNAFWQATVIICAVLIISREILVSGFRILAASKSIHLSADKFGKIKTVFQMVALIILIPLYSINYLFEPPRWISGIFPMPPYFLELRHETAGIPYFIGFVLLLIATIFTVISGVNYIVRNRQVFNDDKNEILRLRTSHFAQDDKGQSVSCFAQDKGESVSCFAQDDNSDVLICHFEPSEQASQHKEKAGVNEKTD